MLGGTAPSPYHASHGRYFYSPTDDVFYSPTELTDITDATAIGRWFVDGALFCEICLAKRGLFCGLGKIFIRQASVLSVLSVGDYFPLSGAKRGRFAYYSFFKFP